MSWKNPWQQKSHPASERQDTFYTLLKAEIGEIRQQGESPARDGESFSRYICDLCHRASPVSALRQCVICGRWGCPDCWNNEYYVCNSCNGIIRLHMIPALEKETGTPAAPQPSSQGEDAGTRP